MGLKFPASRNDWRFDVVGLLAVIGESAMKRHAQPLTASRLCLLPRLIPAPQALLMPSRPSGLPGRNAKITGIYSANVANELNYFANLLHPVEDLERHTVKELDIEYDKKGEDACIYPKYFSPLTILTIGSVLLSIGLLVWSILISDGVAFLAILVICLASSVVGLASRWTPQMTTRPVPAEVPAGDVVIQARNGAFFVVHCEEHIARELYIATEECKYTVKSRPYQALVGLGTFLLMFAVVLMGNCSWTMQIALGSSYIFLNGMYWIAALLPTRWHWNLQRYKVTPGQLRTEKTFTGALFQTIACAKGQTQWVQDSSAAPNTGVWEQWLLVAAANYKNRDWDAKQEWDNLYKADRAENGRSAKEDGPASPRSLKRTLTVSNIPQDSSPDPKT